MQHGEVTLDSTNPVPQMVGRADIATEARRVVHVNGDGVAGTNDDSVIRVIDPLPSGPGAVGAIGNVFIVTDSWA
jgi:hypothetical protein